MGSPAAWTASPRAHGESHGSLMLRTKLLHPELLATLGAVGHGSQVLITDGNFPHLTAPYEGRARLPEPDRRAA